MKTIKNIKELKKILIDSVSIGTFDGLHLGHQAVVKEVIKNGHSLIVTFEPHPREVISNRNLLFTLTTTSEKIAILRELGVDNLFILKFDKRLANMSAKEFVHWLIVDHIKPERVVVGYNHHFGYRAEGDFELLVHIGAKFGFEVERVPPVYVDGFPISSTRVRDTLVNGEVSKANELLGRPYSISSQVIPGKKIGMSISYPTANLKVPMKKLIPKEGVYAVRVWYKGNRLSGMMNIGKKPTFHDSSELGLEVHIFNFNKNLLHQEVKVEFINYIRENRAFESLEALKNQLKKDEKEIKELLRKTNPLTNEKCISRL
ncbi:MAG: bifunctional riboflavin kinase/FAD synthetase [bacterium]|nr:bifunctional riboflavin kinase/FAD synthetase [bacterium]